MYDREWARRIVVQFRNVRTRTNNLDACIIERCQELMPVKGVYSPLFIEKALIHALQDKSLGKAWRAYQKLQKKTPLDIDALNKVAEFIAEQAAREIEFRRQFVFDFF